MSSSYSANQYESAFRSQKLQNWCETKRFKERPTAQEGHTTFIADDRGHLLPGLVKGGSAWPDFKGTWDLPPRIPARHVNPTGRSEEGLRRLRSWGFDPQHTGRSQTPTSSRTSDAGEQRDNSVHPPSSAAKARPASQSCPVTGGSQKQDCERAESRPAEAAEEKPAVRSAAEEKPAVRSAVEQKPAVRSAVEEKPAVRSAAEEKPAVRSAAEEKPAVRSAAEEKPAVRSAASQRSSSRAHSVTGRGGSDAAQKVVPTGTPSSSKQRQMHIMTNNL
ncbi:protein Flattop [Labrus bergylta]|uniref:protein Flattop n=1 Tax=Labrus bergylta TaxID=56723 RepID=UPI0033136776